jgi:uncharacterized protein YdaU (DUF1376 family)
MNFYPFHIGDYLRKTRHLTDTQDLIFRRMLDIYYMNEKPLSLEISEIGRLILLPRKISDIRSILEEFFVEESDGWHSQHADKEIISYREKAERAKKANERRWQAKPATANKINGSDITSDIGNESESPQNQNQNQI